MHDFASVGIRAWWGRSLVGTVEIRFSVDLAVIIGIIGVRPRGSIEKWAFRGAWPQKYTPIACGRESSGGWPWTAFFGDMSVRATTDKPARFEIVTARGVQKTVEGTSVEWTCPADDKDRKGPQVEVFARIRATALDGCGERLFSQAYMLT